jgi:hypothetical protein
MRAAPARQNRHLLIAVPGLGAALMRPMPHLNQADPLPPLCTASSARILTS